MPMQRQFPNQYSTQAAIAASTGVVADSFGFNGRYLRLLNTEAVDWYVNLTSTVSADTGSMRVRACSEVVLPSLPPFAGFAAYTTSTGAGPFKLGVTVLSGDAG